MFVCLRSLNTHFHLLRVFFFIFRFHFSFSFFLFIFFEVFLSLSFPFFSFRLYLVNCIEVSQGYSSAHDVLFGSSSFLSSLERILKIYFLFINNLYPRIFSPTMIKKKIQDSYDLDFFLFLSIGHERSNVTLSATIFYSFCRCMQGPTAAHAGLTTITTTSRHVRRQLPFSQKATSIYLEKPELNFPPIEETLFFLSSLK